MRWVKTFSRSERSPTTRGLCPVGQRWPRRAGGAEDSSRLPTRASRSARSTFFNERQAPDAELPEREEIGDDAIDAACASAVSASSMRRCSAGMSVSRICSSEVYPLTTATGVLSSWAAMRRNWSRRRSSSTFSVTPEAASTAPTTTSSSLMGAALRRNCTSRSRRSVMVTSTEATTSPARALTRVARTMPRAVRRDGAYERSSADRRFEASTRSRLRGAVRPLG